MSKFREALRGIIKDLRLREALIWCLPALIAGAGLRIWLTVDLPYGYYQADTPDFLDTADNVVNRHRFRVHGKKTFLTPVVYVVPFLLHIRALIFIPLLQHLVGLLLVVLIGVLCRLWFTHWKWFIVPLTVLIAINPALLWYEHTLMAESLYAFTLVLLAVAGTVFALRQTRGTLVFLCAALVLISGARPEGKLLFGFALFLVTLLYWGRWREGGKVLGILAVVGVATHFLTRTTQAGLLIYTSVAYLTPDHVSSAPGFAEYFRPTQEKLIEGWEKGMRFAKAHERKIISEVCGRYIKEHPEVKKFQGHGGVSKLGKTLAQATFLHSPLEILKLGYWKFRYVSGEPTNGQFTDYWLRKRQFDVMFGSARIFDSLAERLTGTALTTKEETTEWVKAHYVPERLEWFNRYDTRWHAKMLKKRLPDTQFPGRPLKGMPLLFVAAFAGMFAIMLRRNPLQKFHIAFGLALMGLLFTICVTANVKPRFRFVFEPFWYLYVLVLLDCVISAGRWLISKFKSPPGRATG
ncbi:MAG: hypothetical protein QOD99_1541 [Chthoniobacter sp.]|nr:hypothetical protein [Chthoniobacter sp.]